MIRKHVETILIAVIAAATVAGGPVIAQSVVDFARNADKVDGLHAVEGRSTSAERAGKLIATDRRGFFPDFIVGKVKNARNAKKLGGLGSSRFVQKCGAEAVVGKAFVHADVAPQWEQVPGYGLSPGGPTDERGNTGCFRFDAQARHVGLGTYQVTMTVGQACEGTSTPLPVYQVLITAVGDSVNPLAANYRTVCSDGKIAIEVAVSDMNGVLRDASFTIAQLNNPIPIP